MTRKPANLIITAALIAAMGAAAFGVRAMQARQLEREIAAMPVVRMEPVVVVGERAPVDNAAGHRLATNPTARLR
jgi:hypothetical protein